MMIYNQTMAIMLIVCSLFTSLALPQISVIVTGIMILVLFGVIHTMWRSGDFHVIFGI